MVMTFPRAMPALGIATDAFELERYDYAAPEDGGRIGGITGAPPKWLAKWTLSKVLPPEVSDEWRAWVASLRGSQNLFLGYDRERPFPRDYRHGFAGMTRPDASPFDGAATDWGANIFSSTGQATMTLQGFPVGLVLNLGDYVGFKWDSADADPGTWDRRAKVRVTELGVALGDGEIGIGIEPPVDLRVVPADAIAHVDNPSCLMKLVPDQCELAPKGRMGRIEGGSIVARQVMLP